MYNMWVKDSIYKSKLNQYKYTSLFVRLVAIYINIGYTKFKQITFRCLRQGIVLWFLLQAIKPYFNNLITNKILAKNSWSLPIYSYLFSYLGQVQLHITAVQIVRLHHIIIVVSVAVLLNLQMKGLFNVIFFLSSI